MFELKMKIQKMNINDRRSSFLILSIYENDNQGSSLIAETHLDLIILKKALGELDE